MDLGGIAVLCFEAEQGSLQYREHVGEQALERDQPSRIEIIEGLCQDDAQIIEPYPLDYYGRSCLIWSANKFGRVLHLNSGYPPNNWVITVYWPDLEPDKWTDNFKVRVQ